MSTRLVESARVYCVGLKKRDRTVKRHGFKLYDDRERGATSDEDLRALALDMLRNQIKTLSPDHKVTISVNPETIEDIGDGFISRSFMVYQDRKIDMGLVRL